MKLYKYRPLSELLFKELHYQELYFASYAELNDPLDLIARIEFTPENEENLDYLLWFIFKATFKLSDVSKSEKSNQIKILNFSKNEKQKKELAKIIFDKINELKKEIKFIDFDSLILILKSIPSDLYFEVDIDLLSKEIERITKRFLSNSYTSSFSENNNDFLMWSHYASKHSGICLEFDTSNRWQIPYIKSKKRVLNPEKYLERISEWSSDTRIYWGNVKKVSYQNEQPFINFFDFSPVFDNESNCDLISLSKTWTHHFAYELESAFCTKTLPWKYENEWRAIDIHFGEYKEPEERIRHYPIECLSGIYFGIRTPESVKVRVYKIFRTFEAEVLFYNALPSLGRELNFELWEHNNHM